MTFNDIPHMAQHYIEKYQLVGWRFEWDNAKRRAGSCQFRKKIITLSRHYAVLNIAERLDDVIDTILHEIAHALAGPGAHHNVVWQAMCVKVGARPEPCYDSKTIVMPTGSLVAVCGGCGKRFTRFKRPKAYRYHYCLRCGPSTGRLTFRTEQELARIGCGSSESGVLDTPPPPSKLR